MEDLKFWTGMGVVAAVVIWLLHSWSISDLGKRVNAAFKKIQEVSDGIQEWGSVELLEGDLFKSTDDAMCWDIFSPISVLIPVHGQVVITTNVKTKMHGCSALIFGRSGLAAKPRVTTRAGVIDENYPDYWGVVLVNEGPTPYQVSAGDRIAQVWFVDKQPIDVIGGVIQNKERTGGFGSTGN